MTESRALLIALKLGFGVLLLIACVICCCGFYLSKPESVELFGAAVGALATFFIGMLFVNAGLDPMLWAPLKPERRDRRDDEDET